MRTVTAKLAVVLAVAAMVAGGLDGFKPERTRAASSTADAAVIKVCRFLPFSASSTVPGAFSTVFAVTVTNVGTTASDGPVEAGLNQPVQARQKRDLKPVTPGPLAVGQTTRFKWADAMLFPGVQMTMIAVFDNQTNPAETWENNMTFADPWTVPAC